MKWLTLVKMLHDRQTTCRCGWKCDTISLATCMPSVLHQIVYAKTASTVIGGLKDLVILCFFRCISIRFYSISITVSIVSCRWSPCIPWFSEYDFFPWSFLVPTLVFYVSTLHRYGAKFQMFSVGGLLVVNFVGYFAWTSTSFWEQTAAATWTPTPRIPMQRK